MKIRRILYPTDFSPCAEQALDHALFLARQYEAELHILNAVVLHADDPANPERQFPGSPELLERMTRLASERMAELVPQEHRDVLRVREVQERGFAAGPIILEYADEHDVDLIVMGTHGRRAAARFFLGSVATEVVRHAECPVFTVREAEPPREVEAFERILVPIDFSRHSLVALAYAKDLASRYRAGLQLLHVIELATYPTLYGPAAAMFDLDNIKEVSFQAMERAVERTPGPEVPLDKHVASGRVASEISAFAKAHESDLVVISTHGLSGLERMLTGSTAEQVTRVVDCPVFTVKAFGKQLIDDLPEEDLESLEPAEE